jgi:hypothetical protein
MTACSITTRPLGARLDHRVTHDGITDDRVGANADVGTDNRVLDERSESTNDGGMMTEAGR